MVFSVRSLITQCQENSLSAAQLIHCRLIASSGILAFGTIAFFTRFLCSSVEKNDDDPTPAPSALSARNQSHNNKNVFGYLFASITLGECDVSFLLIEACCGLSFAANRNEQHAFEVQSTAGERCNGNTFLPVNATIVIQWLMDLIL